MGQKKLRDNSRQTYRLPKLSLQFGAFFDERNWVTFTVRPVIG
jgi:hypothetical protein